LDRADEAFRPAFQPVVEASEQDLYFAIAFHDAETQDHCLSVIALVYLV
jgi:hypothetical protein